MRFKVGPTVYDAADIHELTLKMILQLEQETAAFGRPITIGQLETMAQAVESMKTDQERALHPDAAWVLGITIWASRKLAGEKVSFEDAIDFPLSQLTFLPEPQDHKQPANPQQARRKASGRAAAPRKAAPRKKTSAAASTAG